MKHRKVLMGDTGEDFASEKHLYTANCFLLVGKADRLLMGVYLLYAASMVQAEPVLKRYLKAQYPDMWNQIGYTLSPILV